MKIKVSTRSADTTHLFHGAVWTILQRDLAAAHGSEYTRRPLGVSALLNLVLLCRSVIA